MRNYRELNVWEKSHALTLAVYQATRSFPKEELFNLIPQVRQAAFSIPANLAEGCGCDSQAELSHFSLLAMGSANELEYHLLLCHDLHYLDDPAYEALSKQLVEVKKLLAAFIRTIRPVQGPGSH